MLDDDAARRLRSASSDFAPGGVAGPVWAPAGDAARLRLQSTIPIAYVCFTRPSACNFQTVVYPNRTLAPHRAAA